MTLTLIIIIVTGLISYTCLNDSVRFNGLKHSPYHEFRSKEYFRMLSSGFVHGSIEHLLINMYVLYNFGTQVEYFFLNAFGDIMGRINFLLLYLLTIVFANIPTLYKHRDSPHFASVGASGAVSGLLFVFVLLAPWSQLSLFFIIPCPAILAAILYLVYSSWASKNRNDGIDHDAHFAGAVFGMLFALVLKPELFGYFVNALLNNNPYF